MGKPIYTLVTFAMVFANLLAAPRTSAAEPLTVRTFDAAGVTPQDMAIARAVAGAILRDADLTLDWRDCSVECDPASNGREIVLRIVRAPKSADAGPLGYSRVDRRTGEGTLATIYADRIASAAGRTRLEMGMLLGRATAHEIGHLLLGTNQHSERGLMRALWSDRELRRDAPADWV